MSAPIWLHLGKRIMGLNVGLSTRITAPPSGPRLADMRKDRDALHAALEALVDRLSHHEVAGIEDELNAAERALGRVPQ